MIPMESLLALFRKMYSEHWAYIWGKAEQGCVDCSGAFTYAFRQFGRKCPHGSNAIARTMIAGGMLPVSEARPGMAAFKARSPGESRYDLPEKYRQGGSCCNGDLNDYYHVGLVDEDTGYVLNAKGKNSGFCRDRLTKQNGWDCVARLRDVGYEGQEGEKDLEYTAYVTGGALNLRSGPSIEYKCIERMPAGSEVTVLHEEGEWCYVRYRGRNGYAMKMYLSREKTAPGEAAGQPSGQDNYKEQMRAELLMAREAIDRALQLFSRQDG